MHITAGMLIQSYIPKDTAFTVDIQAFIKTTFHLTLKVLVTCNTHTLYTLHVTVRVNLYKTYSNECTPFIFVVLLFVVNMLAS